MDSVFSRTEFPRRPGRDESGISRCRSLNSILFSRQLSPGPKESRLEIPYALPPRPSSDDRLWVFRSHPD
jgi:hypothetical protein